MPRQMHLNAFDMACGCDYARRLEAGLFDGIFFADVVGVYDVLGGSPDAALRGGVQVPVNDPMLLIPAMAAATQHLGFGVTANLTYEAPYLFARRMSTLDHLTQGRIGWNIVTGYLDSAARAAGYQAQAAHDDRYDLADEYMALMYALWEGSWEEGAVLRDRATGRHADPARVHAVHHHGKQYRVDALHLCEPSPQRTPLLYQAGASARGTRFAATHAECVFINGHGKPGVKKIVDELRAQAVQQGRAANDVKVFLGASVICGRSEAEARDKYEDYRRYADPEAALAHAAASMGIDFAKYEMDEPIVTGQSQAIVSNVDAMTRSAGPQWTKRKLLEQMPLGSRQPPLVGSAEQVAEALIGWTEECGVDGFNLSRSVVPECFDDFIAQVVPILQERGAYKTAYAEGTLRRKLFARDRLPASHPVAGHRV